MKSRKSLSLLLICSITTLLIVMGALFIPINSIRAQDLTSTLATDSIFIRVTYIEPINVRGGPNSVYYPVVGNLEIGAIAPALGRSIAGEWIKINFPEASDGSGVGWVYAALVIISEGFLPIIEPPPTIMPAFFITLNPAYAISIQPEPTQTRLSTFTAVSPIVIYTYANPGIKGRELSPGVFITVIGSVGIMGLLYTLGKQARK